MDNPNTEFFLPTVIDHLIKQKHAIISVELSPDQWVGITYPRDKSTVSSHLKALTDAGYYPEKLW
jgi:DNA-binding transcriptional ArsR family regulator